MLLREFTILESDKTGLIALSQFLLSRAEDENSQKIISVDAFIKLAHDMGIPMTRGQLLDAVAQEPLSNLIDKVDDNRVIFKGSSEENTTMSVSDAEKTVEKMSKRAANKTA